MSTIADTSGNEDCEKLRIRIELVGSMLHPDAAFVLRTHRGWLVAWGMELAPLVDKAIKHCRA